ncbi:unnamed protein product [Lathyrus sativus]|nr:unnamed protein product [Lathyrus sativus]
MPKVRREKSPAMDCSESYPYPSSSSSKNLELPKPRFGSAEDWKEWDDTRCSICMETPHNTVILKCSSYEFGCRPYMCNTSYRHSNCLDQFCKSFDSHLSSAKLEEIPLIRTAPHDKKVRSEVVNPPQFVSQLQPKLICPLCRGGVYGYMVSEPARRYMNGKRRTCSSETCEFQGTYPELRKHARLEHPSVRPSEVDFSRWHDWSRMEQQRDFEDLFSSISASSGADYSGEEDVMHWAGGLADMMSILAAEMYSPDIDGFVTSLFSDPTPRAPSHDRRSETIYVIPNDTQTTQSATPRSIFSSTHFTLPEMSYPMPTMPSHDRRSETMRGVSNNTQTNQPARRRSTLPSTHQGERIERGGLRFTLPSTHQWERIDSSGWRSISSSSRDQGANSTARWRENIPPSRMAQAHSEIVENYYRELSPRGRTSSTRRPRVSHTNPQHSYSSRRILGQQFSHTNSRHNYSSYRRTPGGQQVSQTNPPGGQQVSHTNPRRNHSSTRIPGRHLQWRNHGW